LASEALTGWRRRDGIDRPAASPVGRRAGGVAAAPVTANHPYSSDIPEVGRPLGRVHTAAQAAHHLHHAARVSPAGAVLQPLRRRHPPRRGPRTRVRKPALGRVERRRGPHPIPARCPQPAAVPRLNRRSDRPGAVQTEHPASAGPPLDRPGDPRLRPPSSSPAPCSAAYFQLPARRQNIRENKGYTYSPRSGVEDTSPPAARRPGFVHLRPTVRPPEFTARPPGPASRSPTSWGRMGRAARRAGRAGRRPRQYSTRSAPSRCRPRTAPPASPSTLSVLAGGRADRRTTCATIPPPSQRVHPPPTSPPGGLRRAIPRPDPRALRRPGPSSSEQRSGSPGPLSGARTTRWRP